MFAALSAMTAPFAAIPLPLTLMLLVAVASIVTIGIVLRRLRAHGNLTFVHTSTGAAAAAFVLATALLAGASIGVPSHAAAVPHQAHTQTHTQAPPPVVATTTVDDYQPIDIGDLEGYQLPTE